MNFIISTNIINNYKLYVLFFFIFYNYITNFIIFNNKGNLKLFMQYFPIIILKIRRIIFRVLFNEFMFFKINY